MAKRNLMGTQVSWLDRGMSNARLRCGIWCQEVGESTLSLYEQSWKVLRQMTSKQLQSRDKKFMNKSHYGSWDYETSQILSLRKSSGWFFFNFSFFWVSTDGARGWWTLQSHCTSLFWQLFPSQTIHQHVIMQEQAKNRFFFFSNWWASN